MGIMLYIFLFLINVVAFATYGIDKRKAVYGLNRISEKTLITLAIIGGAYGAYLAMWLFRHKTLHKTFMVTVPLFLVIWLVCLILLCLYVK